MLDGLGAEVVSVGGGLGVTAGAAVVLRVIDTRRGVEIDPSGGARPPRALRLRLRGPCSP